MPGDRDDTLSKFIETVTELQHQEPGVVSQARLESIAKEIGLSEDDLRRAQEEAEARFARGSGYLEHELFDDAVTELGRARAMAPFRVEITRALADAYAGRWRQSGQPADRDEAQRLYKLCLELRPRDPTLFAALKKLEQRRDSGSARAAVTAAALASVITAVLTWWLVGNHNEPSVAVVLERPEVAAPTPEKAPEVSGAIAIQPQDGGVPASYLPGPLAGTTVVLTKSQLDVYQDRAFYKASGLLLNQGALEIGETKMSAQLIGSGDRLLVTKTLDVVQSYQPRMRPGDRHAFELLTETPADLAEVRLTITRADVTPAPAEYGAPQDLALHWKGTRAPQFKLALKKRNEVQRAHFDDEIFHQLEVEVHNEGAAVRSLKLSKRLYHGSRLVEEDATYAVSSGQPPLAPGERRNVSLTSITPAFTRYEVLVDSIE